MKNCNISPGRPTALSLAVAMALCSQPLLAQDEEAFQVEEVIVTGTRIKGLDLKGATQAIQLGRQDILDSGADSLGQLMQDLTVTGGGTGTFAPSTGGPLSGDTPVGASSVSLRGLDVGSTLTLINGRRATVSSFAAGQASFIDLNSIPTAAVERVEILPTGASATYGADAVAGVVNYVLRRDYEGLEVSGSYGDSTESSNDSRYNLNILGGWSNERHSVMGLVDYFKRDDLYDRDRDISQNSVRPSQQGFFPSFNDLFLMVNDQTEEPQDGGCPEGDFGFGGFGEFCEVDTNQFTSVFDEYESIGGLLTYQFKPNDRVTWYNELIYQQTESDGTSSPANFSRTPVDPENPFWPEALVEDIVEEGQAGGIEDFFGFPIYAWGKLPEPRAVEYESETLRLVSSLEVQLDSGWTVEGGVTYGRNENEQRGISGLVISEAFYNANLGNLCSDGSTVQRWDVDLSRPDADFVGDTCDDAGLTTLWYNPFGGQSQQSDGIQQLLETDAERKGESELLQFDLVGSGELFEFNGRMIQAAFGAEWRREEVEDTPSGVAVASTLNPEPILGFSSTSADADRDQWAVFAEFFIPLADTVDLQLAGRYDDYDTFGGDFNPKVALRWQPIEQLILRGNYSTSFRAPSLAQVGAGTLLSSYTVNCERTPEACDGDPLADGEALFSEDVANDDLDAETADTWGAGFVLSPTEDIDITVDYWSIDYKDRIGIDEDDFIRRALGGEFPVVGVGELPTGTPGLEVAGGFVADAHFQLSNLGDEEVSGVDFTYTHGINVGPGRLTLTADVTWYNEYERQPSAASPKIDEIGEFLYPEYLANARARYRWGDFSGSFSVRHVDEYRDDPSNRTLEAVGLPANTEVDVDSWTVYDLNLAYDYGENSFVQLNVRNLFDEEPPLVLGLSSNVDQINHNSMGRFITLSVTHAF